MFLHDYYLSEKIRGASEKDTLCFYNFFPTSDGSGCFRIGFGLSTRQSDPVNAFGASSQPEYRNQVLPDYFGFPEFDDSRQTKPFGTQHQTNITTRTIHTARYHSSNSTVRDILTLSGRSKTGLSDCYIYKTGSSVSSVLSRLHFK